MSSQSSDVKTLSFEAALKELEGIVSQLERGDVALEQSIEMYERGAALKRHCEEKLKSAQLKVEQIVLGNDGKASTEAVDFEQQ